MIFVPFMDELILYDKLVEILEIDKIYAKYIIVHLCDQMRRLAISEASIVGMMVNHGTYELTFDLTHAEFDKYIDTKITLSYTNNMYRELRKS